MKILKKKHIHLVFPFVVALMMSCIMSAYITYINLWVENYILNYLEAWYKAFILALPISYIVIPTVRKLLEKISY